MIKNKRLLICFLIATVCFSLASGCGKNQTLAGGSSSQSESQHSGESSGYLQNEPPQDQPANEPTDALCEDNIKDRVVFGKKYYYLGNECWTELEYYAFNENQTATYTHIMKENETVTFHQVINFKWTYAGDGQCILIHNGTKMIKGNQDDAQGFCRVMHLSKDIVYWSVAQKDTYFVCEDFTEKIPKYGKLI